MHTNGRAAPGEQLEKGFSKQRGLKDGEGRPGSASSSSPSSPYSPSLSSSASSSTPSGGRGSSEERPGSGGFGGGATEKKKKKKPKKVPRHLRGVLEPLGPGQRRLKPKMTKAEIAKKRAELAKKTKKPKKKQVWIAEIKVSELRHRWCENKAKPLIFADFNRIFK